MTNLSVRGVDDTAVARLKEQAKSRGISLNAYLVELIQKSAGVRTKTGRRPEYRDLDDLAGTWTTEDIHEFEESQRAFNRIDEELWG
jgi:hypothetical protein